MKLLFIDGGPASGKNTLGELVTQKYNDLGEKTILLDLDIYVEALNPSWIWENEKEKEADQVNARIEIAKDIDRYLRDDYQVIVIGERFLSKADVENFVSRLDTKPAVYLYHLSVPYALREKRLHERGAHALIDLPKDQKDRDAVTSWPGYLYENINSPEEDASNLLKLIQKNKGVI